LSRPLLGLAPAEPAAGHGHHQVGVRQVDAPRLHRRALHDRPETDGPSAERRPQRRLVEQLAGLQRQDDGEGRPLRQFGEHPHERVRLDRRGADRQDDGSGEAVPRGAIAL
jgi:hypothetical protein